jgi:hypothetical protein
MCVILYTEIDGKKILAKNRDRNYKPHIQIIHEIVNGIEIAYIKDLDTGWVEGLNEHGYGLVNATLLHKNKNKTGKDGKDGKEGKGIKNSKTRKNRIKSIKRNKIYNLLFSNKSPKNLKKYILNNNDDKNDNFMIEGNSLLILNNAVFHIENNHSKFSIEEIHKPTVYANQGIKFKELGWTDGVKGMSAFLRKKIVETELKNNSHLDVKLKDNSDAEVYDNFMENVMNVTYTNVDPMFHPYRDKKLIKNHHKEMPNNKIVFTNSELILNITDKELIYYHDKNNNTTVKYINKLPKNHVPKIRIIINETKKNLENKKKMFTKKYLDRLSKTYLNKTKKLALK